MKLIVAEDKKFERHNFIEKIIRIFTVPLLNNIPEGLIRKILSTNKDGKIIIEKGGSAHSLEILYTRHQRKLWD